MNTKATTRTYIVIQEGAPAGSAPRLVKASTQAQAVAHVAKEWTVRVASQADLEAHLPAGVKVEIAGAKEEAGDE